MNTNKGMIINLKNINKLDRKRKIVMHDRKYSLGIVILIQMLYKLLAKLDFYESL